MNRQDIEVVREKLESLLSKEKVLAEDFILSSYIRDGTNLFRPLSPPSLITLPHTTEEVQKIIQVANEYKIPVVPCGGRTSLWGAIDSNQGIVIDMSNMNQIIEIDERNLTFTAQGGANISHINVELGKRGFCYAGYPTNRAPRSLGAEVAKNTHGEAKAMYGAVSKRIIGLEVVLGNGDIIVTGSSKVIKNAPNFLQSGLPDLTHLFVASEGAFGAITEVTMAMTMKPVVTGDIDAKFEGSMDGFNNLLAAAQEIRLKKLACAINLVDPYNIWKFLRGTAEKAALEGLDERSVVERFGYTLAIAVDSFISQEDYNLREKVIREICEKHGGEPFKEASSKGSSPEEGAAIIHPGIFGKGLLYWMINAEIPPDLAPKLYTQWYKLVDQFNWPREKAMCYFTFCDEGCYPMCFLYPNPHDEMELKKGREIMGKLMESLTEAGAVPYRIGRILETLYIG